MVLAMDERRAAAKTAGVVGRGGGVHPGVTQLLLPTAAPSAYAAIQRQLCLVNIKQLAFGIHHYESVNGTLPPVALRDATRKPLHSWLH